MFSPNGAFILFSSLCKECKVDPATCESAFTAPSSGGDKTAPPLQSFTQTVLQIVDENCIPLMMVHLA